MGKATKWMSVVRKKFLIILPHPQETRIVLHTNLTQQISSSNTHHHNNTFPINNNNTIISAELKEAVLQLQVQGSNERDQLMTAAGIKIQTLFRSHLARRAFRALRSLVKLQALVRGVLVRRQARMAIHCMHALARLHITVRARQIFT